MSRRRLPPARLFGGIVVLVLVVAVQVAVGGLSAALPATEARIWATVVRVGSEGSIYLSSGTTIRRIAADGVISTLVGSGQTGAIVNGSSARGPLSTSVFAIAPDGAVVFVEKPAVPFPKYIWRVSPPLPGYEAKEIVLASSDGHELYVFDAAGRHLRTQDALTGALAYLFEYNGSGELAAVVDRDALRTTIERDAAGKPTAIVAPSGQRNRMSRGRSRRTRPSASRRSALRLGSTTKTLA